MARSNKPILWLPFAGGGLVAALLTPVLILITGVLMPLGFVHLPHETVAAFAHNPIGKVVLFGAVALPTWHAAHRLRMTAHDLGLGGGIVIKLACYGTAGLLILAAADAAAGESTYAGIVRLVTAAQTSDRDECPPHRRTRSNDIDQFRAFSAFAAYCRKSARPA